MTDLNAVHQVFRRWLGEKYDIDALDAVLAVAAAEQLDGDPPWLLVVSGSGNAKTETVVALSTVDGVHVKSTISSEGALLSATVRKERAKDATGGLLKEIGARGVLVLKDFTSIISMNRDSRALVLAALREVHDGRWVRSVGVDGGKSLSWTGRLVLIGATTTAYDSAHAVLAAMGDRFALVRMDSADSVSRRASGRQSLRNVGHETVMRDALSAATCRLLTNVDIHAGELAESEMDTLLDVADLVTLARTAVERDYRGDVVNAHAPEMPTRFAKMLAQIMRGGLAIGMARDHVLAVAVRVAGDSMPPLRLAVLLAVQAHPDCRVTDVRKRLQKPHNTINRELQALHVLGLVVQYEAPGEGWRYHLAPGVDENALKLILISRKPTPHTQATQEEARSTGDVHVRTDISGNQDRLFGEDAA